MIPHRTTCRFLQRSVLFLVTVAAGTYVLINCIHKCNYINELGRLRMLAYRASFAASAGLAHTSVLSRLGSSPEDYGWVAFRPELQSLVYACSSNNRSYISCRLQAGTMLDHMDTYVHQIEEDIGSVSNEMTYGHVVLIVTIVGTWIYHIWSEWCRSTPGIGERRLPMLGVGPNGRVDHWSVGLEMLCRVRRNHVIGQLVHPATQPDMPRVPEILRYSPSGQSIRVDSGLPGRTPTVLRLATYGRGSHGGFDAICTDMPGAKQSQDDLQRLVQQAAVPIVGLDDQGIIVEWNDHLADRSGHARDDMVGQNFVDQCVAHRDQAKLRRSLAKGGGMRPFEVILVPGPGSIDTTTDMILQLRTGIYADVAATTYLIGQDMTELRRAKAERDRMWSTYLAHLCHEIRNPLHGITGSIDVLRSTGHGGTATDDIATSAATILRLVDDVLEYTGLRFGKGCHTPSRDEVFAVTSLCTPTGLRALVADMSVATTIVVDPELPEYLLGDRTRVGQLLANAISNAVRYTPSNGTIEVSIGTREGSSVEEDGCWGNAIRVGATTAGQPGADTVPLIMEVRDSGSGMSQESLRACCEPYTRGAPGHAMLGKTHPGTGLGLSICVTIVEAMGGYISVRSAPGQGTAVTFVVYLLLPPAVPERVVVPELVVAPEPLRGLRVLVVDDQPVNQRLLVRMLEKMDMCTVINTAGNGQECLDRLARDGVHYDYIFMDICMPVMDGLEATGLVRAESAYQPVCIVGTTASATREYAELCTQSGMDQVLVKPFDRRDIQSVLLSRRPGQTDVGHRAIAHRADVNIH